MRANWVGSRASVVVSCMKIVSSDAHAAGPRHIRQSG